MQNRTEFRGLGIADVIQIVLIMLKLFHVIDWSWSMVLIPLWASLVTIGIFFIIYLIKGRKK